MNRKFNHIFKCVVVLALSLCFCFSFIISNFPINISAKAQNIENATVSKGYSGSSGSSSMNTEEINIDDIPENTFMQKYFKYLYNNFPNNPAEFCVYVSLTMILSYYDTWWDDNILGDEIIENTLYEDCYDVSGIEGNSPGVEFSSNAPHQLNIFMVKLIENPYSVEYLSVPGNKVWNSNIPDCISKGLIKIGKPEMFLLEDYGSGSIENAIDELNNDRPVMVCIEGHATVAFAYGTDNNGQFLYAHNGYKEDSGKPRIIKIYGSQIKNVFTMELNNNNDECLHVCSNNYTDRGCPCDLAYHPAHEEKHHKLMITEAGHTEICDVNCGLEAELEAHIFERTPGYVDSGHNVTCVTCGYITTEAHYFIVGEHIDEYTHYVYCECGYDGVGYHWDFPPEIFGAGYQHYLACSICEYSWIEDHFPYYYEDCGDGTYRIWCYCGYALYYTDLFPSDLEELP